MDQQAGTHSEPPGTAVMDGCQNEISLCSRANRRNCQPKKSARTTD
jgi:hypothetical protein